MTEPTIKPISDLAIRTIVENCFNQLFADVQEQLGVEIGDVAGHYVSDNQLKVEAWRKRTMAMMYEYVALEMDYNRPEDV